MFSIHEPSSAASSKLLTSCCLLALLCLLPSLPSTFPSPSVPFAAGLEVRHTFSFLSISFTTSSLGSLPPIWTNSLMASKLCEMFPFSPPSIDCFSTPCTYCKTSSRSRIRAADRKADKASFPGECISGASVSNCLSAILRATATHSSSFSSVNFPISPPPALLSLRLISWWNPSIDRYGEYVTSWKLSPASSVNSALSTRDASSCIPFPNSSAET
mmetsp:Transcript_29226/g.46895  ORF Transcript_29226/g.46895 Transcript_29226/m.46895 type:complete len:216 (+) Transcript_29226:2108-2755(+)